MTNLQSKILRWLAHAVGAPLVTALFLISLALTAPSGAQSAEKAPVVLDGRPIFQLSSTEELSAQERADWINYQLQTAVKSEKIPNIQIEKRNRLPTLLLNGRYLFTVTQQDTTSENSPAQQAQIWAKQLDQQLKQAIAKRSSQFLWRSSVVVVLVLAGTLALNWVLGRLWSYLRQKLGRLERKLGKDTPDDSFPSRSLNRFLKLTLLVVRSGLWLAVILWITNFFPWTRKWSYFLTDTLISSLTSSFLSVGDQSYSVIDFLILIGLLLGLMLAINFAINFFRLRLLQRTGLDRGIQEAIAIVTKYALLTLGTIIVLQVWGLDLSSLTILASALGIGIGFGFQDIVKNFTSGFVLIFERSVQVGDFIEIGSLMGTVERMGSRSTEIKTLDGVSIIVPNSRFLTEEVINWSHRNSVSRIHLPVGVAYQSDVNLVRKALLEAAQGYPRILSEPAPQVLFKGFGDSALDFELLVWIAEPSTQPAIASDLNFRIEAALERHGIEIPFPQQDFHLRSGILPISLSSELQQALLKLLNQFQNPS